MAIVKCRAAAFARALGVLPWLMPAAGALGACEATQSCILASLLFWGDASSL